LKNSLNYDDVPIHGGDTMPTAKTLLKQNRREEVWQKYCGFIDLDLPGFMAIQERLLLEQIELLAKSAIGRQIMKGNVPQNVQEFRELVPLTNYHDYISFLSDKREDILPCKPQIWARTSGRSLEFDYKWVPYSPRMAEVVGEFGIASFILASCSGRGDIRLNVDDHCLYTLAPPPYFTGAVVAEAVKEQLNPIFIPPLEKGNEMTFEERIREGFKLALKSNIDLFYGLSSVLVKIAEQFEQGSSGSKFSISLLDPRLLFRMIRGLIISKLKGRPLLPRDLWNVKAIVAGGMDTSFYRDTIETYWGRKPLEGYGGTEIGGVALQAWNLKGMTFLPDFNFLEFIPEEDFYKSAGDSSFEPSTRRLDEVAPGVYELVITNFHGGVFVRYRTGDLIEIISLGDEDLGIQTPQMKFHARADGVIDVAGFTRLTEKAIWEAIEESGINYIDWLVKKEYAKDKPYLHLYIESKNGDKPEEVKRLIHKSLAEKDSGYAELEKMLGIDPLKVSLLSEGAFSRYIDTMRSSGADLAHLKPPRINPSDEIVARLTKG
jgi:hypothetical protein